MYVLAETSPASSMWQLDCAALNTLAAAADFTLLSFYCRLDREDGVHAYALMGLFVPLQKLYGRALSLCGLGSILMLEAVRTADVEFVTLDSDTAVRRSLSLCSSS